MWATDEFQSHQGITPPCGKPKSREQDRCTSGSVSREPRRNRGYRGKHAELISKWGQPVREDVRSWLHRLVRRFAGHARRASRTRKKMPKKDSTVPKKPNTACAAYSDCRALTGMSLIWESPKKRTTAVNAFTYKNATVPKARTRNTPREERHHAQTHSVLMMIPDRTESSTTISSDVAIKRVVSVDISA